MKKTLTSSKSAAAIFAAALIVSCGSEKSSSGNDAAVQRQSEAVSTTAAPVAQTQTSQAQQPAAFSPYVDADGNISRPENFLNDPNWTHIGNWTIVNENGEGNGLHNVYTTYDAVKAYRASGVFPDGAVLVKEVLGANANNLTTGRVHWKGDNAVWFVMVKDAQGRFADNPLWGEGWGWALFQADNPAKQVATDYKADCLECHVPAKDTDWIYVQAYPVLSEK